MEGEPMQDVNPGDIIDLEDLDTFVRDHPMDALPGSAPVITEDPTAHYDEKKFDPDGLTPMEPSVQDQEPG